MTDDAFFRLTELERSNWPEIRDQILQFEHDEALSEPRSYPGYPRWPLDRVSARLWPPLDRKSFLYVEPIWRLPPGSGHFATRLPSDAFCRCGPRSTDRCAGIAALGTASGLNDEL